MARNRSGKDTWQEWVEGHQARSRSWAPRRIKFSAGEREALAESADLDADSTRGRLFVDAVALLCGSLPGRAQALDEGRPGAPMRHELLALEKALVALQSRVAEISERMLGLSSAAEEGLASEVGGAEPAGSRALWKLRERLHGELSPLKDRDSALIELAGAATEAAKRAPGQGGGRPTQSAKRATIKELVAVFQLMHQRPLEERDRAFAYFFAMLRPTLEGEGGVVVVPTESQLVDSRRWCRAHHVPRLREGLSLDASTLETRLRKISLAFTEDHVVSATDFDAEHTARVNAMLASERQDPPEDE